ncbi:nitrous oxide-stimulated promoter family protein [Paraferrimonas haliotis]|uniref:nitrous oxide-stimulated promoter family protein n=1 Tax=Paraferrimonas haliotis TaxID=2013866 RepID=UPI000BA979BC|nr:nitrous oxide-stimulated promoter family protein [Paraferrimonas haliotis]
MASEPSLDGVLAKEYKTIEAMVAIYCKAHHSSQPCEECQQFLAFAHKKLVRCPYGEDKPTCAKCPIHCYKPDMRAKAKTIMRFAGPRMLIHHPVMAIRHLLAERRPVPAKPPKGASARHKAQSNSAD